MTVSLTERRVLSGAILFGLWLAVSLPRLHGPIDLRWDASTYYILGTSLAEGKGYRLLNEPGEIQAVQYPPLLPLLVAIEQKLLGTSDFLRVGYALRLTYFLLSGLYLVCVYHLSRQLLSPLYSFFVTALSVLSFNSFFYPAETLYADLPFALVSALFLLCQRTGDRRRYAVAAGLLACAAYLLRTAGIVLLAAWVLQSVIQRQWGRAAIRMTVAALPILLWQGYILHVTRSAEYRQPQFSYQRAPYYYPNVTYAENGALKDPFRPELGRGDSADLQARVMRNIVSLPIGLGESCWFGQPLLRVPLAKLSHLLPHGSQRFISASLMAALVLVGVGALIGGIMLIGQGEWHLALYFGLTLALVVLTPWPSQFWRYLSPIAPLTLIFFVVALLGLRHVLSKHLPIRGSRGHVIIVIILGGMLSVQGGIAAVFLRNLLPVSYYGVQGEERSYRLLTYEPHWHALDRAFEWIRRQAKPGEIVATSVPQLAFLRTQHKAVLPPFEQDPIRGDQLLTEVPAAYLVVDELRQPPISDRYAAPVAISNTATWKLAFTVPESKTQVYERVP